MPLVVEPNFLGGVRKYHLTRLDLPSDRRQDGEPKNSAHRQGTEERNDLRIYVRARCDVTSLLAAERIVASSLQQDDSSHALTASRHYHTVASYGAMTCHCLNCNWQEEQARENPTRSSSLIVCWCLFLKRRRFETFARCGRARKGLTPSVGHRCCLPRCSWPGPRSDRLCPNKPAARPETGPGDCRRTCVVLDRPQSESR